MIKKLRVKFIAITMCSLLMVLVIIIGSIDILNYRKIVSEADDILSILQANEGKFPRMDGPRGKPMKFLSPETPYESRFFTVVLNGSGQTASVDTGRIAAIDTQTAVDYAKRVWNSGHERGFVGNYRYVLQELENGTRIIFLDCGRSLSTFQIFLFTSFGISAIGFAAVFLLIVLFSRRAVRPVLESYEKQRQFITDAGHEIKTPLTIIGADAEILQMELGENEWIEDIQKQAKRLTALTNDLICLARMEERETPFQMLDFPLSDVVGETAQSFQALARTQDKDFTCRIQPMLSFYGDESAVRQLVSILLDNALKYSIQGGTVSLSLEKQGRWISLSVFNTAESVPAADLEHLFDRFYRTDKSRNSNTGGHGIGLSIAKAIVETHKGKISASTKDGSSLLITVALPA